MTGPLDAPKDLVEAIAWIMGDDTGTLVRSLAEQRSIDHLDFPVCAARNEGEACTRAAEFLGHCKTDGCESSIGPICGPCVDRAATRRWKCAGCGAQGWFRDVHELTPLGGA